MFFWVNKTVCTRSGYYYDPLLTHKLSLPLLEGKGTATYPPYPSTRLQSIYGSHTMKTITVLICALLPFRTYVCLAYDEWGQDDTLVEDTETFVGGQLVLSTQNINGSSAIVLTAQVIPINGQRTKKTANENDEGSGFSSSTPTPMFVSSSTQTTTATTARTTTTTTTTTTTLASPTSQPGHDQTRGSDELITKTTAPPSVSSPDDKSDKTATSDPTGWTTKDVLRK